MHPVGCSSERTWNPRLCPGKWAERPSSLLYQNLFLFFTPLTPGLALKQGGRRHRPNHILFLSSSALTLEIAHSFLHKQQPSDLTACILSLPEILEWYKCQSFNLKEFEDVEILLSLNKPCLSGARFYQSPIGVRAMNSLFCPSSEVLKPWFLGEKPPDIVREGRIHHFTVSNAYLFHS